MIDTHCHLTYEGLVERLDQVLLRARSAGVDRMVSVGTSPDDARQALALAQRYESVYAAAGLHPHYAHQWPDRAALVEPLRELAGHERVVAFGEMGLDYHYPDPPPALQRRAFEWQLQLAAEVAGAVGGSGDRALPVIIHNREATADTLAILRDSGLPAGRFVFHCFTGTPAELDGILAFGALVGFTGITTFKSAGDLAAAAATVPLERVLLETDSPYLTPEPHRKVRPNEPCFLPHTARFLAQRRGMDEAAFVQAADANAERFYGLR